MDLPSKNIAVILRDALTWDIVLRVQGQDTADGSIVPGLES